MNNIEDKSKISNELKNALKNLRNNQKKCPYCGMRLIERAKFCKNCGKKI